ncbi:hypothetical protein DS901_00790 [Loktanella sp. D2R18]|uniref:hypothetical protein n=1 Tax=Rhodobacterales TaxID=204455 RepID=UPI000DE87E1D|nr:MULTISPECIES: hypothetical protein [Rhodobacterales]MDO6591333.1 hypothetical protein [Yoonia sp. 1_MG-2023]RBW46282.1 hypothetical protein DS901_00790 [Loktanella sp. D2R18]
MHWLSDVTIFNESTTYAVPDDISIYRTLDNMCSGMEPWMVEAGGIGFALNGLGQRIDLDLDGNDVIGSIDQTHAPDPDTLLTWLNFVAKNKQDARILRSQKKAFLLRAPLILGEHEAKGAFPDTVEGLLAYIHL